MDYAKKGSGWKGSKFGSLDMQCLALCEIVKGYTANPYYVIKEEDHVVTRYLMVFNSGDHACAKGCDADNLQIPKTHYGEFSL